MKEIDSGAHSLGNRSFLQALNEFFRRGIPSDFVNLVAETFVTKLIILGIGLITTVIVARVLGPEGRGFYAVASTIGALGVQFGNLGLHASNTYSVARDRGLLPPLVANTMIVSFVIGGAGSVLIWVIFLLWPQIAPLGGFLLILSLLWIPFGLAYLLLQNLLLGIQNVRAYNTIELVTKALALVFMGLLVLAGTLRVETFFSVTLATLIMGFLWALVSLRGQIKSFFQPRFALFKENIRYGIKVYLATFFSFLIMRVNLLMVQYILGPKEVGYYSVAAAMADAMYVLPVVIGTILFPKLSAMTSNEAKWVLTRKLTVLVGLAMAVLVGFAALISREMVRFLYGAAYLPAVPVFRWLMLGVLLLSMTSILSGYIASQNIPWNLVILYVLFTFANIVLNWYLLPILGVAGAGVSSTISHLFILLGIVLISRRIRNEDS